MNFQWEIGSESLGNQTNCSINRELKLPKIMKKLNKHIMNKNKPNKDIINNSLVSTKSASTSTEKTHIHPSKGSFVKPAKLDFNNLILATKTSNIIRDLKLNVNFDKERAQLPSYLYKNNQKHKVLSGSEEIYRYEKASINTEGYKKIYFSNLRRDFKGKNDINNSYLQSIYEKIKNKNLIHKKNAIFQITHKTSEVNCPKYLETKSSPKKQKHLELINKIIHNTTISNNILLYPAKYIEINNIDY